MGLKYYEEVQKTEPYISSSEKIGEKTYSSEKISEKTLEYKNELARQLVKRFGFNAARKTCIVHDWEGVLQEVNRFSSH